MRARATVLVGLLGCAGVVTFLALRATSDVEGDPFDAPLYWWTWGVFPALAALATFAEPPVRPVVWAAALHLPLMVGVGYLGTFGHDPDDGASLWLAGEMFLSAQAAVTLAASQAVRNRRWRKPSRPTPSPRA